MEGKIKIEVNNENKKKIVPVTIKEPVTPRVPVILKSDREPAHVETREKKTLESKPAHSIKSMLKCVKLIDENMEINPNAIDYLSDAGTNYLVVGAVGRRGVGKSTILNLISENRIDENFCNDIRNSSFLTSEPNTDDPEVQYMTERYKGINLEEEESNDAMKGFRFKMCDMSNFKSNSACTRGIDMYVTNERVILLDCQAMITNLWTSESSTHPLSSARVSSTTLGLQLISFLIGVCHVLVVVEDWFTDYNLLRYIQSAEMLKPQLVSHSSTSRDSQDSFEAPNVTNSPHLLLIQNRCSYEDFEPESVRLMQRLYRNAFKKSSLQLSSGMYLYSDAEKKCVSLDKICESYSTEICGNPINLFLLPEIDDNETKVKFHGHPPFEVLAKRLRQMVLGANRHQITNVANLSERGWHHFCTRAWDTIRKNTFFMEYERILHAI